MFLDGCVLLGSENRVEQRGHKEYKVEDQLLDRHPVGRFELVIDDPFEEVELVDILFEFLDRPLHQLGLLQVRHPLATPCPPIHQTHSHLVLCLPDPIFQFFFPKRLIVLLREKLHGISVVIIRIDRRAFLTDFEITWSAMSETIFNCFKFFAFVTINIIIIIIMAYSHDVAFGTLNEHGLMVEFQ